MNICRIFVFVWLHRVDVQDACLELAMRVCLCVSWLTCRVRRACHSQSVRTVMQSVPAPAPFHCGPASETEHEAKGIEVH